MTLAAAALSLALPLGQQAPPPHAEEHGQAPAHHLPAEVVPEHGAPAAHGGGHGGHEATLPETMMHHVANGYVLELPGICDGFH